MNLTRRRFYKQVPLVLGFLHLTLLLFLPSQTLSISAKTVIAP